MSARSARLNVRIPEDDLKELEAIRERTGQQTVSDVARDAIAAYVGDEAMSWNSDKITATIPSALADDVDMFIASGDASDVSQAVTLALTTWVEERKRYYLEGKDAIRSKIAETTNERDTRKGMSRVASKMRIK
ncbi:MAG: ribbon-helix-helix domain-containing protein [Candidatus Thermoplasmatota archaeon]|nr:ribbon-helix-helix domain-containing protein [Candidatus Thermoplasmatota archaeon]